MTTRRRILGVDCLLALLMAMPAAAPAALQARDADQSPESSSAAPILFRDAVSEWGLVFDHHNGGSGAYYMVEANAGGVLIVDYDSDGDDDVIFVDGGALPGYAGDLPATRLYRNEGSGRFVDATVASGLEGPAYGTGGSAADVDGDGDIDLYLTGYLGSRLLRNRGDGRFEDRTLESGTGDAGWTTSAAFLDFDRDGDLDLYSVRYLESQLEDAPSCLTKSGKPSYCHPDVFEPTSDRMFENLGNGRFADVSESAGAAVGGKGLGIVTTDFDGDGWPDIYIANDMTPNHLLRNRGDGTFEDISLLSGTAYGDRFVPEAGMGVDAADIDLDGDFDLVVTNYALETNALYLNQGGGIFAHGRHVTGLAAASIVKLGFGVDFVDLDLDGDEDLVVANGHVLDNIEEERPGLSYRQVNQVFVNVGGRFEACGSCGLDTARVSRGLATGDLDGDGDLDLIVVNTGDRAEVYENASSGLGGYLQLELHGAGANSAGIGSRLEAVVNGRVLVQQAVTASSFQSQNSLVRTVGLGSAGGAESLAITWPDGGRQRWRDLPRGHRLHLVESTEPHAKLQPADGRTP